MQIAPQNLRVLVVDSDPLLRESLRRLLAASDPSLEVLAASGPAAARRVLDDGPIDVLLTEERLTGEGLELLEEARHRHPDAVRMAFGSLVEAKEIVPLIFGAHRCFDKPLRPREMATQLERVRQLRARLGPPVRAQIGELAQLPAMPRVFAQLGQALAAPNASAASLAAIVELDTALAAKVLQLANSSFFSRGQPVADLQQAVVRAGVETLRALTLLIEAYELPVLANGDRRALQRHALLTARLAVAIVDSRAGSELAFSAGLLHDIGKLALAVQRPVLFEACWRQAGSDGFVYHELEQVVAPPGHGPLGGYLLGLWGLPVPIVDAVLQHHEPLEAPVGGRQPSFAVKLGNRLANEAAFPGGDPQISAADGKRLGIEHELPGWRRLASEEQERLAQLF